MDRDMSGALFRNDKGDNERRPDYQGDITINGVKWRRAAWLKDGRNGKFLSLKASEDRPREEAPRAPKTPDLNDEIPF